MATLDIFTLNIAVEGVKKMCTDVRAALKATPEKDVDPLDYEMLERQEHALDKLCEAYEEARRDAINFPPVEYILDPVKHEQAYAAWRANVSTKLNNH